MRARAFAVVHVDRAQSCSMLLHSSLLRLKTTKAITYWTLHLPYSTHLRPLRSISVDEEQRIRFSGFTDTALPLLRYSSMDLRMVGCIVVAIFE